MEAPPLDGLVAGRTFLVTGSNGFLGRALVGRLRSEGARVVPLTSGDCDLLQPRAVHRRLAGLKVDGAFHLAASTDRSRDPACLPRLLQANVLGTLHLLEALRAPVVHAGTLDEYGPGPTPFAEGQAAAPASPYAWSKLAAGELVRMAGGVHVRLALVYGPGQSQGFFLPQLLEALRTRVPLPMTEGAQVRDILWLDDAVEGLVRAARCLALQGEVVNLCTGVGTSLRDLVALLGSLAGQPVPVQPGALPYREGEVFSSLGSPRRLEERTGWRPTVTLREGLQRMLAGRPQ